MNKKHLIFDKNTREFLSEYDAEESLVIGVWVTPTDSIPFDAVPEILAPVDNMARVFSDDFNRMYYVDDFRFKTAYETSTGNPVIVDYIGPLRDGYQLDEPPKTTEQLAIEAIVKRNNLIREVQNRVDRYKRYADMGKAQIDNITELYQLIDDLANVPQQSGFPNQIDWPDLT